MRLVLCEGWAHRQAERKTSAHTQLCTDGQGCIEEGLLTGRKGEWGSDSFMLVTTEEGFGGWVGALGRMILGLQKNFLIEVTAYAKWCLKEPGLYKEMAKVVWYCWNIVSREVVGIVSQAHSLWDHAGPLTHKGVMLGLMFSCCHYEILNFWTRGPAFSVCSGPCKLWSQSQGQMWYMIHQKMC